MDRRLRISLQAALGVVILLLVLVIYRQVTAPARFAEQFAVRRAAVVERLKDIDSVQQAFCRKYGRYTADFDTLIDFALNDTTAFGSSARSSGEQIKQLRYIPYAKKGIEFELWAGTLSGDSGAAEPVFEARASYGAFMRGIDRRQLASLIAGESDPGPYGGFSGVSVGSHGTASGSTGDTEE